MSIDFMKFIVLFQMLVFLSSCYDYNDYKVDNIVSINYNQQIIRKSLTIDGSDGYFNYKNEPNSQQQPLLNTNNNLHIGICAIDCNEKLHPVLWSTDGKSFILHFYNRNDTPSIPFGERLFVFKVVDGKAINVHQIENKKIIKTFYSDNILNYITSDNKDTIKVGL